MSILRTQPILPSFVSNFIQVTPPVSCWSPRNCSGVPGGSDSTISDTVDGPARKLMLGRSGAIRCVAVQTGVGTGVAIGCPVLLGVASGSVESGAVLLGVGVGDAESCVVTAAGLSVGMKSLRKGPTRR